MEETNLKQDEQSALNNTGSTNDTKPAKYFAGFLTGLVTSVLLGGLVAIISCWLESVHSWVVAVATLLIGVLVQFASKRDGFISGLISAICGAIAVVVFTFIVESQGYCWEDGTSISEHMVLYIIAAALMSGWTGYKQLKDK